MTYKARYIKKTQYEILLLESMLLYFSNVQYIKSISKLFCLFSLDLLSKEGLKPVLQRSSVHQMLAPTEINKRQKLISSSLPHDTYTC